MQSAAKHTALMGKAGHPSESSSAQKGGVLFAANAHLSPVCLQKLRALLAAVCLSLSGYESDGELHRSERASSWHVHVGAPTTAGALPGIEPGGEREIAARVKRAGRSANVKLGSENKAFAQQSSWPGTPRDLPEKERHP